VYNPDTTAYMNVISGNDLALRGHGNDPRKVRTGRVRGRVSPCAAVRM
jgi:hypothetical protein